VLKNSILSLLGRNSVAASDGGLTLGSSAPDSRRHERIETVIPVSLHSNGEDVPAVVRNISPAGAMVEASLSTSTGDPVHLVRGELCAKGTVIWCLGDRRGMQFSAQIDVDAWLAPAAKAGQARVDEIVALVKAGAAVSESEGDAAPSRHGGSGSILADDLTVVTALLGNLKDDLTRSSDTVDTHGAKLEHLDQAMEMLSDEGLIRRSRHQLADELGVIFQLLVEVEDDVTGIRETVARHGYKLQNLDLAMQMLMEVGSEMIINGEEGLSSNPRLNNLRGVCDKALHAPAETH